MKHSEKSLELIIKKYGKELSMKDYQKKIKLTVIDIIDLMQDSVLEFCKSTGLKNE